MPPEVGTSRTHPADSNSDERKMLLHARFKAYSQNKNKTKKKSDSGLVVIENVNMIVDSRCTVALGFPLKRGGVVTI